MQERADLVELKKLLKMNIWLQKSALTQPRTGLSTCADAQMHHPPPVNKFRPADNRCGSLPLSAGLALRLASGAVLRGVSATCLGVMRDGQD